MSTGRYFKLRLVFVFSFFLALSSSAWSAESCRPDSHYVSDEYHSMGTEDRVESRFYRTEIDRGELRQYLSLSIEETVAKIRSRYDAAVMVINDHGDLDSYRDTLKNSGGLVSIRSLNDQDKETIAFYEARMRKGTALAEFIPPCQRLDLSIPRPLETKPVILIRDHSTRTHLKVSLLHELVHFLIAKQRRFRTEPYQNTRVPIYQKNSIIRRSLITDRAFEIQSFINSKNLEEADLKALRIMKIQVEILEMEQHSALYEEVEVTYFLKDFLKGALGEKVSKEDLEAPLFNLASLWTSLPIFRRLLGLHDPYLQALAVHFGDAEPEGPYQKKIRALSGSLSRMEGRDAHRELGALFHSYYPRALRFKAELERIEKELPSEAKDLEEKRAQATY